MGWLDPVKQEAGELKWLQLVETLRSVSEGKVGLGVFSAFIAAC